MKLFKVTTDNEIFYVLAETRLDAEVIVTRENFYEKLDDELSDLMDTEEVTKPGIIISVDSEEKTFGTPETFQEQWSRVRSR